MVTKLWNIAKWAFKALPLQDLGRTFLLISLGVASTKYVRAPGWGGSWKSRLLPGGSHQPQKLKLAFWVNLSRILTIGGEMRRQIRMKTIRNLNLDHLGGNAKSWPFGGEMREMRRSIPPGWSRFGISPPDGQDLGSWWFWSGFPSSFPPQMVKIWLKFAQNAGFNFWGWWPPPDPTFIFSVRRWMARGVSRHTHLVRTLLSQDFIYCEAAAEHERQGLPSLRGQNPDAALGDSALR